MADAQQPANQNPKPEIVCPKCKSKNTKQVEVYEDSYGALITEYDCLDCGHEFNRAIGG